MRPHKVDRNAGDGFAQVSATLTSMANWIPSTSISELSDFGHSHREIARKTSRKTFH
jgi:hypothetical protein